MLRRATDRFLPGTPRALVAAVAVLSTVNLCTGTITLVDPVRGVEASVSGVLMALMQVVMALAGLWRARTSPLERHVWSRMAAGLTIMAAGTAATCALTFVPAAEAFAGVPGAWSPILGFPFYFGAMIRWNRYSTYLTDPHDMLNGVSAVLATVALLDLAVDPSSPLGSGPWWQLYALLGQAGVGLVLLWATASLPLQGLMVRDPRVWLAMLAFALPLPVLVATLIQQEFPPWAATVQPIGNAALFLAMVLCPARTSAKPAPSTAPTIGAFVVIIASTVVLVLTDSVGVGTWCAVLAVLGSGLRLLANVRELAQLATSRREALTDELTGLANRRAVLRRLEGLCADRAPLVLALLDLDKFKEVNDSLGHGAGDDLLRLVARRLEPVLRPGDIIGRLGGDEFAVVTLLDGHTPAAPAAAALGARLNEALAAPFPLSGMHVHATVSIGLTATDGDGERLAPTQLLRRADAAMYDAKRSGHDVVVYDGTRHGDRGGHLTLVEELRAGIAGGNLVLHYQPQVCVASGRALGVEALVRWEHPTRGLLGPGEFLHHAEVHGLMGPLTCEVLRQAVIQLADWHRQGLELRMSVNLSASNLLDTGLPQRVAELLHRHGVPAGALVLEVTESVLLSDPERSLAVVGALTDLGTTVSIDDFGTGYSSLAYLRDLPVAELKLDRSFTVDLLTDARTEAIVASTIELAHRLGLRVVAEGVEQVATRTHLRTLGCDETQGYLHARPLPAGRFEEWLAAQPALVS